MKISEHSSYRWAVAVTLSLSAPFASADIVFDPGPSNPAYNGTDDPFVVFGNLQPNGGLLVDDSSQVSVGGALLLGGTVSVNSGGLINAGQIALFEDAAFMNPSGGSIFIDAATVNGGFFTPVEQTVLYLGIDNSGLFTTSADSLIGNSSTVVLGLAENARIQADASFVFGGEESSFTLTPSSAMPLMGGSDAMASLAQNTTLVTVEKAMAADRAQDAIAQYRFFNTISPGAGYTFRVDGDATFGGAGSDSLIHIDQGSSFEVTGDAGIVNGGGSVSNIVILGGDMSVGNDLSVGRGMTSSTTLFIAEGLLDVGGNFGSGGNLGISNATGNLRRFNHHDRW